MGLAIPLLSALVSPAFTRRRRAWVDVGTVDELPPGRPTQLDHVTTVRDGWLEAKSHKAAVEPLVEAKCHSALTCVC